MQQAIGGNLSDGLLNAAVVSQSFCSFTIGPNMIFKAIHQARSSKLMWAITLSINHCGTFGGFGTQRLRVHVCA